MSALESASIVNREERCPQSLSSRSGLEAMAQRQLEPPRSFLREISDPPKRSRRVRGCGRVIDSLLSRSGPTLTGRNRDYGPFPRDRTMTGQPSGGNGLRTAAVCRCGPDAVAAGCGRFRFATNHAERLPAHGSLRTSAEIADSAGPFGRFADFAVGRAEGVRNETGFSNVSPALRAGGLGRATPHHAGSGARESDPAALPCPTPRSGAFSLSMSEPYFLVFLVSVFSGRAKAITASPRRSPHFP